MKKTVDNTKNKETNKQEEIQKELPKIENPFSDYNILNDKIMKKLKTNGKLLYIIIDKEKKQEYKPKLLNKSVEVLSKLLKFSIKSVYFEDLNKLPPLMILSIEETPTYVLFSYNEKENTIQIDWYGSGYYLPKNSSTK